MLDHNELSKHFNESQKQDVIHLYETDLQTPIKRIRKKRVRAIKPDHIPRPVNSFISFRTEKQALIRKFCPTANHREISKITARWWRTAEAKDKEVFIKKAATAKVEHSKKYPDYVFSPKSKNPRKPRKSSSRKPKRTLCTDMDPPANSTSTQLVRASNESAPPFGDYAVFQDKETYNDRIVYPGAYQIWPYGVNAQFSGFSNQYYDLLPSHNNNYEIPDTAIYPSYMPYDDYAAQLSYHPYSFNNLISNLALQNYEVDDCNNELLYHESDNTPHSQILNTPSLDHVKSPASSYCQQGWGVDDPCSMLASLNPTPFKMIEDEIQDTKSAQACVFTEQLIKPLDASHMSCELQRTLDDPAFSSSLHLQ
ncbi:HMG-box protein STE11 [Choanephora cucurbitarum]|uniref:HMG-box protein STE11 n=1 Tax=Choanephora cucurbitarum TaxID=101091 RepID=A0A1C7NSN7_9FUNG|nr:HMG-box protein STE11 [Choanephora cucurbitarum]